MSANADILDSIKGNSTLVRPLFSPGLLLRDDDLREGVDYTRNLSRLLVRSLFGCGVVCGLEVHSELLCGKLVVTVDPGVALNCLGDPIHVPESRKLSLDPTCGQEIPSKLWVTLCRTDKCCAPRTTACACDEDDGGSVCTRQKEGFEIRIVKVLPRDCICAERERPEDRPPPPDSAKSDCWCADPCRDCHRHHYEGRCCCDCCDCDCVVLAVLNRTERNETSTTQGPPAPGGAQPSAVAWMPNHSVRRFVRPVLIRDPVVYREQYSGDPCDPPPPAPADDPHQYAMASDIAATDEAANRTVEAARIAIRKGAEVHSAAADGRLADAQAAATEAHEKAVVAKLSAEVLVKKAAVAAATAQQEVDKITAERKAAEKELAAMAISRTAAAGQAATGAVAAPEIVEANPKAAAGAKKAGAKAAPKAAKPGAA